MRGRSRKNCLKASHNWIFWPRYLKLDGWCLLWAFVYNIWLKSFISSVLLCTQRFLKQMYWWLSSWTCAHLNLLHLNLLGPHPWLHHGFLCHVYSVTFKLCFLPRFTAFESWASRILQPQTARAQRQPLIYQSKAKPWNCSLINHPTHPLLSPPSLSISISFCYPLWQGASLHASELLKLGQTTPLGISWSRLRRRSSPRGVRMKLRVISHI